MRLWLKDNAGVLARDGLALAGAGLVIYGVQLVYLPAGFIVAGGLACFASWRLAKVA